MTTRVKIKRFRVRGFIAKQFDITIEAASSAEAKRITRAGVRTHGIEAFLNGWIVEEVR